MDDVGLGLPTHGTKLEQAVSEKSRKAPYSKQFAPIRFRVHAQIEKRCRFQLYVLLMVQNIQNYFPGPSNKSFNTWTQ